MIREGQRVLSRTLVPMQGRKRLLLPILCYCAKNLFFDDLSTLLMYPPCCVL